MNKNVRSGSSLEREVITAVIALYALICAMVLAIHHLQPSNDFSQSAPAAAAAAAPK